MPLIHEKHHKLSPAPINWPQELQRPRDLLKLLKDLQMTKSNANFINADLQLVKSPLKSKVVLQIVGTWAYLIAKVFNKTRAFNAVSFNDELKKTELQLSESDSLQGTPSPLITLSNHISCIDDPILWGSLLPLTYFSRKSYSVRWAPAATEICFGKPWQSNFFSLGKAFPITRGLGLQQPALDFALGLLNCNQWLHFFPEGRVMRDKSGLPLDNEKDFGYKFRWGISKLIIDYLLSPPSIKQTFNSKREKYIRVLPFYHLGLDAVLPIGWPYIPRFGNQITIYFRPSVIELDKEKLLNIFEKRSVKEAVCRKFKCVDVVNRVKLTNYLEDEMQKLVEPASKLHTGSNMQ